MVSQISDLLVWLRKASLNLLSLVDLIYFKNVCFPKSFLQVCNFHFNFNNPLLRRAQPLLS